MSKLQRTIFYDRNNECLQVWDGTWWPLDQVGDGFIAPEDGLMDVKAADLKLALRSFNVSMGGDPETGTAELTVTQISNEYFNNESPAGDINFRLVGGKLVMELMFVSKEYLDEGDEPEEVASRVRALRPYLERNKMAFLEWQRDGHVLFEPFLYHVSFVPVIRGRKMGDLYSSGQGVLALLRALSEDGITRETTLDLLRAGKADILLGQPEGAWLDVKSDHYDLGNRSGKISLAQSVSRFANAEYGGIVVVGMKSKKVPGGEEIKSVCPLPFDRKMIRSYQHAIENHLYPPPDCLDIEPVSFGGGMLVLVHVPPQPEELKPFLVHGAIVDGSVEGAFISIVRRRGETSIPITAPAIHATMASGRALLRRGKISEN